MRIFTSLKSLYIASCKPLLALPIILFLISGCIINKLQTSPTEDQFSADNLAKDWRAQVRKNPTNPYEGRIYPEDNDINYYAPKKRTATTPTATKTVRRQPSSQSQLYKTPALEDNEDSYYGKFPRYNPDDDNVYTESKDYPLYQE